MLIFDAFFRNTFWRFVARTEIIVVIPLVLCFPGFLFPTISPGFFAYLLRCFYGLLGCFLWPPLVFPLFPTLDFEARFDCVCKSLAGKYSVWKKTIVVYNLRVLKHFTSWDIFWSRAFISVLKCSNIPYIYYL